MKQGSLLLIIGMMLFAGCSSVPTKDIKINTQTNPKVDLAGYTTYTWQSTASVIMDPSGRWEPPAFDADTEIKHLIDRELRKRGMMESSANPDLLVAFAVGLDMDVMQLKVDPKTKLEVLENVPAGALLLALVDPSSGFVAWAGAATLEIQEEPDIETANARLDYVVTRMFKDLPKSKTFKGLPNN
jgi:hypothetical protein